MAEVYSSYDGTLQGSTSILESEKKVFLVKYPNGNGGNFSLILREKANPIGFTKQLNGTGNRR